jgi:pimeloyl-ACP methyl ester carboxylesterase
MTSLEKADPSVVLVHGAYADGSSWSEVIKLLHGAGITGSRPRRPARAWSTPAGSALWPRTRSATTSPKAWSRVWRGCSTRCRDGCQTYCADRTTAAAWRSRPSWYAISRQDRTISPELQRFMAGRREATTVEIEAGHLSLITHPGEVTQLIMSAVQAVRLSAAGSPGDRRARGQP